MRHWKPGLSGDVETTEEEPISFEEMMTEMEERAEAARGEEQAGMGWVLGLIAAGALVGIAVLGRGNKS